MKDQGETLLSSFEKNKKIQFQKCPKTFSEELFETAVKIIRLQGEEILKNSSCSHISHS